MSLFPTPRLAFTALALAALAGCAPAPGEPPATSTPPGVSTPAATATPSAPTPGDPVLAAIAQGVPADSFAYLLATAPGTTAKERPTPWAAGWKVYDLENGVQGSPQRLFVALGPDKKALLLSAEPDNVVQLSKTTRVQDAPGAVQRAKDYLELSRSMARLSYAVDSVDQIDWLPKPTADDTARKQKLVQDYATRIKPAAAKPAGDGWTVEVWTVDDRSLALHTLSVGRDGTITDSAQTLEKDIPVPYSV